MEEKHWVNCVDISNRITMDFIKRAMINSILSFHVIFDHRDSRHAFAKPYAA